MAFIPIEGENKIALQQGNEQLLNITHFVLANIDGLGSEPADRIETMPDPADIVDTRPVTKSGYVNANQVVYSLTLDSTIGDYSFNWIGLKDADDVLIMVLYLDDPITKTATSGGIDGNNLVRNFLVAFSDAQATTAINAPAETWQIDFTARLLQIDERERLSNFDIYGHDAFFDGGFDVSLDAGTVYNVSAGVGYVGGIRCAFDSTQQIDVGSVPNGIWVDASLQGDLTGLVADVQLVASNTPLVDYQDGNGINHYVAKLCDLSGGGLVTDTKTKTSLVDDHEGKADPHTQYLKKANVVPQAEAETGTATTARAWTAQRVKQAISAVVKAATETVAGIAEVATQAETDMGSDDARFVTPKKLRWGFSMLLASPGYIALPSWLGGVIMQWGLVGGVSAGATATITLPLAFTNNSLLTLATNPLGGGVEVVEATATQTAIDIKSGSSVGWGAYWFTLGH